VFGILNDSGFVLGRHIVEQAIIRGHDVMLCNRGNHSVEFSQTAGALIALRVRRLIGHCDSDVSAIERFGCDAVIDCSGYTPEHLDRALHRPR